MKQLVTLCLFLSLVNFSTVTYAAPAAPPASDLVEVLEQAVVADATFKAAQAQFLSSTQNVPIAMAALLPFANVVGSSLYNVESSKIKPLKVGGTTFTSAANGTFKYNSNSLQVNLQQTLFNYTQWLQFQQSKTTVKQAEATYIAAAQNLISRTAAAYFNVLYTEDILRYVEAEKKTVYEQLDQANEQFKVGVIAITAVYQAQAQYDSIVAEEISAQNNIINAKEDLRTITGIYYDNLASLKALIPLEPPQPNDPEKWVGSAIKYNWTVQAARYAAEVAKESIGVSGSEHLPTLNAVGTYNRSRTGTSPNGQIEDETSSIGIQLNIPVFEGGLVIAQTQQARYNYLQAFEVADQTLRSTMTDTRKSYNNVIAGISTIQADRKAIISNASSLRSTIEGYNVGAQTMVDILIAQTDLFEAQQEYARDEYGYIDAIIQLKEDAGTLSFKDIVELNGWLSKTKRSYHEMTAEDLTNESNKLLKQLKASDKIQASKKDTLKNDLQQAKQTGTNSTVQ